MPSSLSVRLLSITSIYRQSITYALHFCCCSLPAMAEFTLSWQTDAVCVGVSWPGAGEKAIDWSPFANPVNVYVTLCPLCGGTGVQKCMNCLGSGKIVPML